MDPRSMASPRIGQWAERGVYIMARPWPCGGSRFTTHDFSCDFVHGIAIWPGGQNVPRRPSRTVQFPASACDVYPPRAQCTAAKLRAKRGRAAWRKRTAVEQAI